MSAVNKLVCLHVRTMFMFVSFLCIQQGCHAWIIQTNRANTICSFHPNQVLNKNVAV